MKLQLVFLFDLRMLSMRTKFKKVKAVHHILQEYHKILLEIEKIEEIARIVPGRINRQQKWSSQMRFKIGYATSSWIKCIMTKGSTAQELFCICNLDLVEIVRTKIEDVVKRFAGVDIKK